MNTSKCIDNIKRYAHIPIICIWLLSTGYILGILNRPTSERGISIDLNEKILDRLPIPDNRAGEPLPSTGQYFASINGTKYYPASCSSSNRIKAGNRIWFNSEIEAKEAGYEIAKSC